MANLHSSDIAYRSSRRLSRPHPLLFLLAYLAGIPFFAAVYDSMEMEFYQATSRQDRTFTAQQRNVERSLEKFFVPWLKRYAGPQYQPVMDPVFVSELDATVDTLRFTVAWQLEGTSTGDRGRFIVTYWELRLPSLIQDHFYWEETTFYAAGFDADFIRRLPSAPANGLASWSSGMRGRSVTTASGNIELAGSVSLPRDVYFSMLKFRRACLGQTINTGGSYWRFLYFSAITQTTVGFGDIVPISDKARLWVASQAVAGVMLAGLFLNAVAARVAHAATGGSSG